MLYDWIKAGHLIAMISWMAGMLYLPRLYVYHADAAPGSDQAATFALMERRLLRYIMNPAMLLTFGFGLWLIHLNPELFKQGWLHAKLALVLGMTAMHGMLARWRKGFAAGHKMRDARFYRIVNEVPTVLLIGIVILATVKPF